MMFCPRHKFLKILITIADFSIIITLTIRILFFYSGKYCMNYPLIRMQDKMQSDRIRSD
jgi:hypothetical protein